MGNVSTENLLIKKANRWLVIRNAFLLGLILLHFSIYFEIGSDFTLIKIGIISVCTALWLFVYIKYVVMALKASKNTYLKNAFRDEYFYMIKIKSGYHGFVAMLIVIIALILLGLMLDLGHVSMVIPSEIVLYSGILVSDISKIVQSRGE